MSNTYDIHCDTCKKTYWFGQHSKEKGHSMVYNSDKLGKFLTEHRGHSLYVTDEYSSEEEDINRYDYDKDYES